MNPHFFSAAQGSSSDSAYLIFEWFAARDMTTLLFAVLVLFTLTVIAAMALAICLLYRRKCRMESDLSRLRIALRRFRTVLSKNELQLEKLKNENERLSDELRRKTAAVKRLSQFDPDNQNVSSKYGE